MKCSKCHVDKPIAAFERGRRICNRCRYMARRRVGAPLLDERGLRRPSELDASAHPTTLDIAWAAGLFEGEGTAFRSGQTRPGGKHYSVSANIAQKDRWILDKAQTFFGGRVATSHPKTAVWWVTGTRARAFLYTIFTFLSPRRRRQVRKALGIAEKALMGDAAVPTAEGGSNPQLRSSSEALA